MGGSSLGFVGFCFRFTVEFYFTVELSELELVGYGFGDLGGVAGFGSLTVFFGIYSCV